MATGSSAATAWGQITVLNNGTIDHTGAANPFALFMDTTQPGGAYGVFNFAGGNMITGAQPLRLGNSTANGSGNSGFFSLASGTFSTGSIWLRRRNSIAATYFYANYAGGTFKAATLSQWISTNATQLTFDPDGLRPD